jgi:hypothetical protein
VVQVGAHGTVLLLLNVKEKLSLIFGIEKYLGGREQKHCKIAD